MLLFFGSFHFALHYICASIYKSSLNIFERHVVLLFFDNFVCFRSHIKFERLSILLICIDLLFLLLFLFLVPTMQRSLRVRNVDLVSNMIYKLFLFFLLTNF